MTGGVHFTLSTFSMRLEERVCLDSKRSGDMCITSSILPHFLFSLVLWVSFVPTRAQRGQDGFPFFLVVVGLLCATFYRRQDSCARAQRVV
jgi:hypothetical protein